MQLLETINEGLKRGYEAKILAADLDKKAAIKLRSSAPSLNDKGGSGCKSNKKCGVCEGDCDTNADCKAGLKCFQRKKSEAVPGCNGAGVKGHDYCVVDKTTSIPSKEIQTRSSTPSSSNLGDLFGYRQLWSV